MQPPRVAPPIHAICVAFLGAAFAGCAARDDGPRADAVVRDSAGITIVETRSPAWAEPGQGWRVGAEPLLQIGQVDGKAQYLFDRIMGMVRFDDGVIAVGTMGAGSIRYYDERGRFLYQAGRPGRGPGEFVQLLGMKRLRSGNILAEAGGGVEVRMNEYDKRGRFVRDYLARRELGTYGRWSPVGWLDDGTAVAATWPQHAPDGSTGVVLDSSAITIFDGTFYGPKQLMLPSTMWSDGADAGRLRLEFGPTAKMVVDGSRFYYSFSDNPDVFVFRIEPNAETGSNGLVLECVMRGSWPRTPVTEADVEEFKHAYAYGAVGEDGQQPDERLIELRLSNLERMSFAERFPAHGRVMVDRTGAVWLERYKSRAPAATWNPTSAEPSIWQVYDAAGVWLGPVEMPASFYPHEIGADYVIGTWRDEYDVEYVRLYELIRG